VPAPDTAAPGLRTGSLRIRTVVAVLLLLAVLLAALAVTVELTLGQRLRAQVVDRLSDRAAAAAALVGTVDGDELADRLSAQGLSVVIRDANGDAIVAGPSPEQLRDGPPSLGEGGPGRDGPASGPDAGRGGAGTDTQDGPDSGTGTGTTGSGTGATDTDAGDATGASSSDAVTVTSSEVRSDDEVTTLVSRLSDASTITLTTDSRSVGETLVQLRWVMIGASAAFLLIAAIGLALVVRATLRPLDRMTSVARARPDATPRSVGSPSPSTRCSTVSKGPSGRPSTPRRACGRSCRTPPTNCAPPWPACAPRPTPSCAHPARPTTANGWRRTWCARPSAPPG
jgi:two-component system OmpR family sensor kinase